MPDPGQDSDSNMAKYDLTKVKLSYSGNSDEDIHSFVSQFKNYAKLRDFVASKQILAFNSCIFGHARVFLDTIPDDQKTSIEDIVKLLEHNFQGETWRWSIESKLLERKQSPTETLDSYASGIMIACRQLKKSDSEMQSFFIRGLLPELRGFVMAQKPDGFQATVDAARLGCSVSLCGQQNSPIASSVNTIQPNSAQASPKTDLEQKLDSVLHSVSSVSSRLEKLELRSDKPIPTPRYNKNYMATYKVPNKNKRTLICHRCGKVGHKWRNCYAKRDCHGVPLND